jgi:hypothetical protein
MDLIGERDGKRVWYEPLRRPYALSPPFGDAPYVSILFVHDQHVTPEEQIELSRQLVESGCLYAVCAGHECSSWDDSIDMAALEMHNFKEPDDKFVMTTWHEHDTLEDIIFHGLVSTLYDRDFQHFLVVALGSAHDFKTQVQEAVRLVWSSK